MKDFEQKTIQETILKAIKQGKEAAERAAASAATAAPSGQNAQGASAPAPAPAPAETHKGSEPKPRLTLIPYNIVQCLSSLENIYETRLFGWTLAKAQSVLKLYNKDLSSINIEHALGLTRVTIPARLLLNEGDKNYTVLTRAFSLASKKIVYEKDNTIYHLNIIAFPELRKDGRRSMITYVIHNELWHALLDFSRGYRLFSLETYMTLNTKYAIIMYLLISQQSGPRNYQVETLRQLLGCTSKAYDKGSNLFARVIDPSRQELMRKAPWYFEYSATKEGKSHRITEIIITPVLNKAVVIDRNSDTAKKGDELRLRLEQPVVDYLADHFGMSAREAETVETLLLRAGDTPRQLAKLEEIHFRTMTARVKNPAGYLVRSLQNQYR